ncbi:unnamed protein product [Schistosoma curassoni]|uniref:DUF1659 domain-containing protein n=1 Tax=Schistosoma curassoni TaxID=6186 RepID=A0A183KFQ6_9TREM|nr:unnamed protein product [Schistosoma curassoni]
MKAKIVSVAASVDDNIHKGKSKILEFNRENTNPITHDRETLQEVGTSTYLRSIIDEQGGSDADIKVRIEKQEPHSKEHIELKTIVNNNLHYER